MKSLTSITRLIVLTSFCFFVFFNKISFASQSRNLTIFAEPNMVFAISKIARFYSQKHNVIISINFHSSEDSVTTIDSGEPADIFISAHSEMIENLRQKGLIDVYNVGYFARDEVVLVTSKSNPNPLEIPQGKIEDYLAHFNKTKETVILDYEGSSSGRVSKEFIKNLPNINLFKKISEDRSSIIKSLKEDHKIYALVFKSQAFGEDSLRTLAQSNNGNIFYQALVVAGDNMEIAREFLKFLKSSQAKLILKESGFITE